MISGKNSVLFDKSFDLQPEISAVSRFNFGVLKQFDRGLIIIQA